MESDSIKTLYYAATRERRYRRYLGQGLAGYTIIKDGKAIYSIKDGKD